MNIQRNTILAAIGGLLLLVAAVAASAQAPAPSSGSAAQPNAASSPHQRQSTSTATGTPEAQTGEGTSPAAASSPHQRGVSGKSVSAAQFIERAAQDGMTEVKLAELAMQKSQSDAVKRFAEHMQQDHSQANSELESIASGKQVTVPKTLDAEHQRMVDELSKKSGAAFDTAYAGEMVKAHHKAVALFSEAQNSKDSEISSFAAKTLPTLREHQQQANSLSSELKVATAGDHSTTR